MSMQPIVFVSHGGGPLPLLNDPGHADMLRVFQLLKQQLADNTEQPRALLFISAHWEADPIALTSAAQPSLLYDYHGFPPASYALKYPVAGAPELAQTIQQRLSQHGISAQLNSQRGLDHGVFVPALLLFPEADIPCLQLSLHPNLDPHLHLQIGTVLTELAAEGVMIIGSGYSFHNMRAFFGPADAQGDAFNKSFEDWLDNALASNHAAQQLAQWQQAPGARYCHPREEHLMPLLVCVGAAESHQLASSWRFTALGKQGSCYLWR